VQAALGARTRGGQDTFSFVSREANWQPGQQGGERDPPRGRRDLGRIKLTQIDGSLFKFASEQRRVEFIDGKIPFRNAGSRSHRALEEAEGQDPEGQEGLLPSPGTASRRRSNLTRK
jgi:hypothetical protein